MLSYQFTSRNHTCFLSDTSELAGNEIIPTCCAKTSGKSKMLSHLRGVSRDEMNLAEFPLAVLSSRSDPKIKTLEFSDMQRLATGELIERKWIITAADKFGLPTSTDDDVVLGLMQITKDQDFSSRKVYFTRYELLKALRWSAEGRNYSRLTKSLDRLSGVRIKASNAFYDNSAKAYQTVNFGLIDAYEINDSRGGKEKNGAKSFFVWSEKLFDSFRSGFIKKLDLDIYFSLKSSISRRMYRYLDKHTYYKSSIERHLMDFAFGKLGLSRNYKFVSSVKQQVEPACNELKAIGFLDDYKIFDLGRNSRIQFTVLRERRTKNEHQILTNKTTPIGNTKESLVINANIPISPSYEQDSLYDENRNTQDNGLVAKITEELLSRGMTVLQVAKLLRDKSEEELTRTWAVVSYISGSTKLKAGGKTRNPIGLLYRAVESPFSFVIPSDNKVPASKIRNLC